VNEALLSFYHRLPAPLRSLTASARGFYLRSWRYGAETEALCEEALERERWSPDRWRQWTEERLAYVLHRAATAVPYYRALWQARRRAGDRASWDVLANWPVLPKEAVRSRPEGFVAEDRDTRRMLREQTSGTTGTPLTFWRTRETDRAWYALFEARVRRWNGISRRDRWAILGGQLVVPVVRRIPPFWVWNAGLRQLYMSSYHLAAENASAYLRAIARHRVVYLLGYASSLCALAEMALEKGEEAAPLKVAVSNAEPLYDFQRERISRTFRCPVRDTYGMVEIVCAASECASGSLHLWPEAGVTEVVSDASDEPAALGETGRLVSTSLMNADMPLVRYESGDRGALAASEEVCPCGRLLPLLARVDGRSDDVIVTPDGRRVGRLDPVFKADLPIREAQIVQESRDLVCVRVVPAAGFGPEHAERIAEGLRLRLGPEMQIVVEPVTAIPRTRAGKLRGVVSRVSAR